MPPSSHRSLADHDPEKRSKTPEDVDGATPATTIKGGDQDDDATRRQEQLEDGPLEKVNEPPIDPPAGHAAQSFPDGGLQAWLVVLGAWFTTACSFGYISAFGVYQGYYEQSILSHESPSSIAWIGSLQLFLIFFSGIGVGYLTDSGYPRQVIAVGTALLIVAIFTTAECTQLWQFILAQGITGGLGSGFLFLPSTAMIAHWFKLKRGLVYGVLATGSSAGGVIFPIMLNRLIPQVGFKWAVRICAFLVTACLTLANILIRPRLPPRKRGRFIEFHHFKDLEFDLFVVAGFLIILGLYTPIFYITTYARAKGVDPDLSFYILSILNATSILGRVVPNIFADKFGPSNILYPASLIAGILCFCWIATTSSGGIIAFVCFYGPASGSYVATIPAVLAGMTKNMNEIGMRSSLAFAAISFASLAGTPITGAMIKGTNFVPPACFSGAVILAGCAFGLMSRRLSVRRAGTWRV